MSEQQKDPTAVERDNTPQDQGTGPKDPGRRNFLKLAGVGAAAAAVGTASSGCAGRQLDDIPNQVRDDYKPFDQRNLVHSMVFSKSLPDRFPEKTKAWEAAAAKRGKKMDGKPWRVKGSGHFYHDWNDERWREKPGWTQLDFALEKAAWNTNDLAAGLHAVGAPNQGAFSWDQSEVVPTQYQFESKQQAADAIKAAARLYGAARCGITRNDPRWNYQPLYDLENERELSWEKDFPFEPKTVIVCLIEMDYRGIRSAPAITASAAAGQGYSELVMVAGQLAKFLRHLGYRTVGAGNDLAASVPYAVAAGLGQEGRHGALIAPGVGPRVRICKVFTEFEFVEYDRPHDFAVTSFCMNCKRCADACPSQAISFDTERSYEPVYEGSEDPNYTWNNSPGVLKWHNDMKKCFEFWTENGGDCGSCIDACPYNKPAIWHHTLIDSLQPAMPGPIHWLMKEGDRAFGYGSVYDEDEVHKFWKTGRDLRSESKNKKG